MSARERKLLERARDAHARAAALHDRAALLHNEAAQNAALLGDVIHEVQERAMANAERDAADRERRREARTIEALAELGV